MTMNLMKLALLFACLPAWALSLSSITISDTGTNYCRVVGNISPDAYVQVYWGTTPGGPYTTANTYPYLTGASVLPPSDAGKFALDMGALQPGTTYYAIVVARPNINNTTGQIQSSEVTCTTNSGTFPIYPSSPTVYSPTYPTTTGSGWSTIPLTVTSGLYVAASTVTHTGGVFCGADPTWTITAGDSFDTILTKIRFGAVIELPQGTTGGVPDTNTFNGGYILPVIAVDPCASSISDTAHRWVIIRTHEIATSDFPPFGFRTAPSWVSKMGTFQAQQPVTVLYTAGQHFSAQLPGVSATPVHHFWFSNINLSVGAGNGPWGPYFAFGNGEGNAPDAQTPTSYMVLDRVLFTTPAPPQFSAIGVFGTVGTNVFIGGNYIVGFQRSGALGNGIITQECSTGPLNIFNNEVDAAGQGIYFESVGFTACGANPPVMMQNVSVTKNAIYEPPSWLNPSRAGYGAWDGVTRGNFRNPFESKNCQICKISGNWIDGSFSGQNSGEAIFIFPLYSANKPTGSTGERDIEVSFNYVRHAAVFMDVQGTGIIDNCCGYAPDAALNSNVLVHDNLAVDLGRSYYTQSCCGGGLSSNYFNSYGVQNHLIYNNSLGFNNADFGTNALYFTPNVLGTSDGGISSNGFLFQRNLMYFSRGVTGQGSSGIIASVPVCPGGCATFPVVPLPTTTTYLTQLNTTMVGIGSTITATAKWGGNTFICGNNATGAEPWPDLDSAGCTGITTGMPTGDSYPAGNTMTARETAAGLLNVSSASLKLTPTASNFGGAVGANIPGVEAALGIVSNIQVFPSGTSIEFLYTAPDSRACVIDVSGDSGVTWARTTDAGGARMRTTAVTGLTASTAYQYRLMCYYSQSRPWFSFPSDTTNMVTEGSTTTTASSTRTYVAGGTLPSGATQVTVTVTPPGGMALTATGALPVSIASVPAGAVLETRVYKNGGGSQVYPTGSAWIK